MPHISTTIHCKIHDSFRVQQVAGMFDLPVHESCAETFAVDIPSLDEDWSIGAIVGPSGSGKSTIARAAFGDCVYRPGDWPADRAVIDGFGDLPIGQITRTLTAVGFGSPPSWLKPYHVLSTGEKFRCELAQALCVGRLCKASRTTYKVVLRSCSTNSLRWLIARWPASLRRLSAVRFASGTSRRGWWR